MASRRERWFPGLVDAPHKPRYPFGHGLSYTSFSYSGLALSKSDVAPDDTIKVALTVTNDGDVAGTEVVQLYVRDTFACVSRPVQELAGFRRLHLEPGASARVEFTLGINQLAFLDADMRWKVEAGDVDVMVGASSGDLRLKETLRVTSDAVIEGKSRTFYA